MERRDIERRDIERRDIEPMEPVPHRVVWRRADTADTVTVGLAPVDPATALTSPGPGQFVMAWVMGVGEIPLSVSGLGAGGGLELTGRSVGATSDAFVRAEVGGVFGLRGPYGTTWPVDDAIGRDLVVLGGGLGLAPLRLAILSLAAADPGPLSLTVLLGAREPGQLLYADQYPAWEESGAAVHVTVDTADRMWHGSVGTVTELQRLRGDHADLAFICGPELMMVSAARAVLASGTPPDQVHVSLERNMHCGIAKCGRCQIGPLLLCRDGAVVRWDQADPLVAVRGR